MRVHFLVLFSLLLVSTATPSRAAGAEELFPQVREAGDEELRLRGTAELRMRLGLRLYEAALYLGPGVEADNALDDVPRRIEAVYARGIRSSLLGWAARRHLEGLLSSDEMEAVSERLETISGWYPDLEKGDRVALTYVPGRGTELSVNGVSRGWIEGADFASAYFRIWLGSDSVDADFTRTLLGPSSDG